jgi:hypothetical protein
LRERVWWRIEGAWKWNLKRTKTVRTRARRRRVSVAWMSETRPNESGQNQAGEEGGRKRALTRRSSEMQERPEASESMRNAPCRRWGRRRRSRFQPIESVPARFFAPGGRWRCGASRGGVSSRWGGRKRRERRRLSRRTWLGEALFRVFAWGGRRRKKGKSGDAAKACKRGKKRRGARGNSGRG